MFTVHSLRHSHIMHYTVDRGLPLPIVQKQVGHLCRARHKCPYVEFRIMPSNLPKIAS